MESKETSQARANIEKMLGTLTPEWQAAFLASVQVFGACCKYDGMKAVMDIIGTPQPIPSFHEGGISEESAHDAATERIINAKHYHHFDAKRYIVNMPGCNYALSMQEPVDVVQCTCHGDIEMNGCRMKYDNPKKNDSSKY